MKKISIKDFKGIHDRPVIGGFYNSFGMSPVNDYSGLAVKGKTTNIKVETTGNFQTPVALGHTSTNDRVYILTDNAYLHYVVGVGGYQEVGTESGYDNNLIVDQNDYIWIASDAKIGYLDTGRTWATDWTKDHYSFTNGTADVRHPAALVQQYVLWGDGNIVARIDVSGGSPGSFTASALTLPAGYVINDIVQSGTNYRIAKISANRDGVGTIFEWDCVSDEPSSIFNAHQEIKGLTTLENKTYAVYGDGGLYDVDSYPPQLLFEAPDTYLFSTSQRSLKPGAIFGFKNKILIGYTGLLYGRQVLGIWVYDISTGFGYPLCPISSGDQYSGNIKIIKAFTYGSTSTYIYIASEDASSKGRLDYLSSESPLTNGAFYVSPIISDVKSKLKGVKFNISSNLTQGDSMVADIYVSYYNFSDDNILWGYSQQDGVASAKNKLKADKTLTDSGDFPLPEVGDEVTVVDKTNAGYIRRVTEVDVSGDPYVYTLDEDMAGNTENSVYYRVHKFKKFSDTAKSITSGENIFIPCPNQPEFRNLLIKIEFRGVTGSPVLSNLDIIYDPIEGEYGL